MAKILVVDDSPTELHVITGYLNEAGYQTITAENGQEGISVARSELPDLILMDVVMPGLNGFQATRKIRRDPALQHIPVAIITTKDQETDREWGMRQGASAYLVKPVAKPQLLEVVDGMLS
jgi:twitching motility two-component system response regulator PilH